ncbi:sensor histidine kinase [Massilia endophytica]|uniref:sensor histidine kinase n=1 Tax=Massilia endophytica TaxID=2899220 RepID=UPI001E384894|nr:sensor histidine kinase [Massilia endophytica]UGQ48915.1 sensor histidine kinase [Massilia endophytica]
MPSIRLRLLKRLIGPILALNLAGGALIYALAWLPVQLALDGSLADSAAALAARLELRQGALHLDLPRAAERALRGDASDLVYFAVRDGAGRLIAGDADLPAASVRTGASDGIMRGEAVRVASQPAEVAGQPATVTVAKTVRQRAQTRQAIVRALILLEVLFALAAVGLIWFSVSSGLRPLNRMRAMLAARDADELEPLPAADIPYELEPVAQALNGLLERVSRGARAQQDFLANVAHQLRTPLAGLHTQLDLLGERHADPDSAHALALMRSSTERMIRQVNQLLALARAEPGHGGMKRREALALDGLLAETVQHFVEQAARKNIDLGFELEPAVVQGERFLLRDLVDNLIDNAIRYTPEGGAVTVACRSTPEGALLTVEDSGPGIPAARREAVFSRFVRLDEKTTGSGLGLAIVRDIAQAHGATVAIDTPANGQGALFSVHFPA